MIENSRSSNAIRTARESFNEAIEKRYPNLIRARRDPMDKGGLSLLYFWSHVNITKRSECIE